MSAEDSFVLQHQPQGRPYVRHDHGSAQISDGYSHVTIRSDRLFKDVKNCYETCELFGATGQNGEHIALNELIMKGDLNGKFNPDNTGGSRWDFQFKLNPLALNGVMYQEETLSDGSKAIHNQVILIFRHTATEFIPRACPPGVVRSPCDEALVEERQFTYTSQVNATIPLIWRVVQ